MNYVKYKTNAYNLHIIKTDKFKTIMLKINLKKQINKEDITYRNLLTKVLFQSNKNYSTKRELEILTEDLYNLSISSRNSISGNYIITSFDSIFLSEKYTEDDMNYKSINFVLDMIFKPNVENNEFKFFDLAKRLVCDEIETQKDDTNKYSKQRLLEIMDDNSPLSYNPVGYMKDLDKITNKDLYNYYQKMLNNNLIDIFVIGDIDEQFIKNIFKENFNIKTLKKEGISHYYEHKKLGRCKTKKEQLDIKQSKLRIGIKLKDLTDFEKKYVANMYAFILGGSPDSKLFKNVREKNSLCYSINCSYLPVFNTMIISAGINSSDFKKCLSLIKKELNNMTKGIFEELDIEAAKTTYINSLKEIEDSQSSTIRIFESHEYLNFDLLDERIEVLKVTKEDIINFSKKINLDTIYLLEGENDEEN
ncbi:MAG: insulinase family protein [Firmicutes bacterium]|nr:insulinase family protein [Bacillota bacterium]